MSIYGALTTAVSGLSAQARALGAISDNVANSQTIGFKRIDTAFVDFVNAAGGRSHAPGTVIARAEQTNRIQGSLQAVENDTAVAVSGSGFLPVARPLARGTSDASFEPTVYYTRAGDFQPDREGFLVNSAGYVLRGWRAQQDMATGAVSFDRVGLSPVSVFPSAIDPVATSAVSLSANVPAIPAAGAGTYPISLEAFDALGNARRIEATLTQDTATPNRWFLDVDAPGAATDPVAATDRIVIDFGTGAAAGTPAALTFETSGTTAPTTSTATLPAAQAPGTDPVFFDMNLDFGVGPQAMRVSLGTFGRSDGLTQFGGAGFELRSATQNGAPAGSFVGATVTEAGDVVATYDNGRTRVLARIPVVTFADPDALSREDGQAFTATQESGQPLVQDAGVGGAGQLLAGTIERANVDIATEFTKLIVAQRAYSANTRVITASDEMLAETLQMRR